MTLLEIFIVTLGGNVVLLGALGWLVRSLFNKLLARDLEKYKSELALESQLSVENLKHGLQLTAFEHQVTVSKLHEKRAEVIASVYSKLSTAYMEASGFASPMKLAGEPTQQEGYVRTMNAMARFFRYFERNKIYLPEETCAQLDTLVREMRHKVIGIGVYMNYKDDQLPAAAFDRKHENWMAAWTYFKEQVPIAKSSLENDLRVLLGQKAAIQVAS